VNINYRDYANSGSVYQTPDSGGECGVAYEKYFPMPTSAIDKPWYSIEQASVHFTVISTEHPWDENSEQVSLFIIYTSVLQVAFIFNPPPKLTCKDSFIVCMDQKRFGIS